MGLFSSKKKTKVGTSVSRVIEDNLLPDSVKSGMIKGIFENGNVADYLLEELVGSVAIRAERMYEYAAKHYAYGMPSGAVYSATQGSAEVEAVLAAIEGQPILLDYSRYGPINNYHLAWMRLIELHGYDPATNQIASLTAQKGKPVYLESMQVVLPPAIHDQMEPFALEQWGVPSTAGYTPSRPAQLGALLGMRTQPPAIVDPLASEEHVKVSATWLAQPGTLTTPAQYGTEIFTIPLSGFDEESDFFHVHYMVGGASKYWLYEVGAGTHPTLDAVFDAPPDVSGTFFPFVYFRFGKQSMAALEGTPAYETSRKAVKYLGMNYAEMIDAIHENPDIGDVEQAMLVMAVPASTSNPIELRYLFDFFKEQHGLQNPTNHHAQLLDVMAQVYGTSNVASNTAVIQDHRFKMSLSHDGITKKLVAGKIGKQGTYQGGFQNRGIPMSYVDAETGQLVAYSHLVKEHYYRKQVSASTYEEVTVRGLRMTYHIWGKYSTVGDETDSILLIPVDRSISKTYSLPDREVLYARAMHFVFNSRVTYKVKWYQQSWFRVVLIIAAVVLTIIYPPGGVAFWKALIAGTLTLKAIIMAIVVAAIQYVVVTAVMHFVVKVLGVEAAIILAAVAMAFGIYDALDSGSLAGAPWAEDLLKISMGLSKEASNVLQESFNDLLNEREQFGLFVEEKTKLLEDTRELLEGNNLLSPFVLFGEKPENYYNRTVHSGNVGVLGISATSNYVDYALRLPELPDTLHL